MDQIDPSMFPPGMDQDDIADAIANYYYSCTEVTATCPVEATTLGYYPNRGINIFMAIGYAVALVATLALGIRKKTWTYTGFICAGCALELAGYAARIPLTDNPWNKHAFETQIVAIVLSPTLLCISIYLTLKHVCLALNPALSRVRPHLYPFIFVPLDVSCLLVQAIGGALAASAALSNFAMVQHGNRCIIAGIVLQVVVLMFFGSSAADYFLRVKKWINSEGADPGAVALWRDKKFRTFIYVVSAAYSGILIRCIYRIAEMAGGWGNEIMQHEPSFIVLEGFMVLIPCLLLAFFPPGILFPQMAARMSAPGRVGLRRKGGEKSDAERQTPADGHESQQQAVSGDESAPSDGQVKEKPAATPAVVEPTSKGAA
ncbi:RTA1 like protein-domain-containing protein [Chaetomidium leptoderma]|uniref:RTA1 like protein-domain-containing protein n=1 Tax=Chaetomidium leptoderma TaxID=669021 RepID=A0AAN6ZY74_9PEZI|nr:RTA1 like protein-domain-containing protein [Chaetomidium leptoderma]